MRVLSRETFVASPEPGTAVHGQSYYVRPDGVELLGVHGYERRSDVTDVSFHRRSLDNGRTWSEPIEVPTRFDDPRGIGRKYLALAWVDPGTGRLVCIWDVGVFPTDDPLEGMRQYVLRYGVSDDGGRTFAVDEQIIADGPRFDADHWLPGVVRGKTSAMIGDMGEQPLRRSDGAILLPVQVTPAGPGGDYYNPGAGFTYHDCMVLIGRWRPGGRIAWQASERVAANPERSTRGLIEPTIAALADGSILMVMRGSNDARPHLPGYRWASVSRDGGLTWSAPAPWTFDDGTPFHSPSSMSFLLPWRDGRLFWLGNISGENPRGNSPRYPLVIGEVDAKTGRLVRKSVAPIDDRRDGESEHLTLSNFYARADREPGHLVVHMTRLFAHDFRVEGTIDWTADAMQYRIAIDG